MTILSSQKYRSYSKVEFVRLSQVDIDSVVPRMMCLWSNFFLVVQEYIYDVNVTPLSSHMQTTGAICWDLKGHFLFAKDRNNVVMTEKACIVQSVVALLVFDWLVGHLVFKNDLCYNLVAKTAREHQRRYSICCHWEVHVNIVIYCSKIQEVLEIIIIDSSKDLLLFGAELIINHWLFLNLFLNALFLTCWLSGSCHNK